MRQIPPSLFGEEDLLLSLAGAAGWIIRSDYSFDWSPAMYRLFQLEPGCTIQDIVSRYHADDRNHVTRGIDETFKSGGPTAFRYRIVHPSGQVRHVVSKALRRKGASGLELVGVNIDVTQQLHEMDIDFEEMRRMRFIAENARDLIIRYDPRGIVTFASPAAKPLIGYEAGEMVGRPVHEFLDPADHPHAETNLQVNNKTKQGTGPKAFSVLHKNGGVVTLEGNPRPALNAFGEVIEWVDVLRDISERRSVERDLVQALKTADAATRAKSEFLANMSHELRTPLTSIIGFADLIGQDQPLSAKDNRHLDHVKRASRTLLSVVNDILDLSKLEQGAMELDCDPFDFVKLVKEAVALLQPRAEEKNLRLEVVLDPMFEGEAPLWLIGDDLRLTQILLNLVSNAVKFTDAGQVRIGLGGEVVVPGRVRVTLAVQDSGIGISPDQLDRLFERFSQADGSITRRFGGTGLGLAICRKLIELMDGELRVVSVLGEGSRFEAIFELPLTEAPVLVAVPQSPDEAGRLMQPVQVLLAEDNPANQELLRALLSSTGLDLTTVDNGAEALAAVNARAFDLILMDIQMPVLDGVSATRAIRRLPDFAHIPIIALSANVLPGQIRQYEEDGFTAHVGKPINPKHLMSAIIACLDPPADAELKPRPQNGAEAKALV